MKATAIEALIFFCAKQLADEETIDDDLLFELYAILKIHFEGIPTVH
jgi:hypothetical protein